VCSYCFSELFVNCNSHKSNLLLWFLLLMKMIILLMNLCANSLTGQRLPWWLCHHSAYHSFCGTAASASMRTWNWERNRRSTCSSVYVFVLYFFGKAYVLTFTQLCLVSSYLQFLRMNYYLYCWLTLSHVLDIWFVQILLHTVFYLSHLCITCWPV